MPSTRSRKRHKGQIIARGKNKRGETQFLVRIFLGMDGDGKRFYASKLVVGGKRDAEKALTSMMVEKATDTFVRPSQETLKAYVDEWLKVKKIECAASTLHDYRYNLDKYILPLLGGLRLAELSPQAIQRLYTKLNEGGLGARTIEYVHAVLHQALEYAVELGMLARNPSERTKRPKKIQRDLTILSSAQMVQLLKNEQGQPLYPLWLLLLSTGLRPQEALALRWSDLEGDTIRVTQVLSRRADGGYEIVKRAKTDKSERPVTVDEDVVAALNAHRAKLKSVAIDGTSPIFPNHRGGYLDLTNVSKRFKAALRRAGLSENVRLYDTRHSHATALLGAGVNLKWISARLGHSSVAVTEQVYAKVMPEAHREMAQVTQEILRKAANK